MKSQYAQKVISDVMQELSLYEYPGVDFVMKILSNEERVVRDAFRFDDGQIMLAMHGLYTGGVVSEYPIGLLIFTPGQRIVHQNNLSPVEYARLRQMPCTMIGPDPAILSLFRTTFPNMRSNDYFNVVADFMNRNVIIDGFVGLKNEVVIHSIAAPGWKPSWHLSLPDAGVKTTTFTMKDGALSFKCQGGVCNSNRLRALTMLSNLIKSNRVDPDHLSKAMLFFTEHDVLDGVNVGEYDIVLLARARSDIKPAWASPDCADPLCADGIKWVSIKILEDGTLEWSFTDHV